MNNIQTLDKVFQYNGSPITFQIGKATMVNATEMAKPFGKFPWKWLELPSTKEYIRALSENRSLAYNQLVVSVKGGNDTSKRGNWFHEDVALEFARWLSPKFAIWCNDRIKELLKYGTTATDAAIENLLSNPDFAIRAFQQIKEERRKRKEAEEAKEKLEFENAKLVEDNTHKANVIEGLVYDIPVADMRQRINQMVNKECYGDFGGSWRMLYEEFDRKYHMNIRLRISNSGYKGSYMDYIDHELGMIAELYDLACKLFESSYEQLMESWGKYAKRAERYKSQA